MVAAHVPLARCRSITPPAYNWPPERRFLGLMFGAGSGGMGLRLRLPAARLPS
jgi:hypothetical protein